MTIEPLQKPGATRVALPRMTILRDGAAALFVFVVFVFVQCAQAQNVWHTSYNRPPRAPTILVPANGWNPAVQFNPANPRVTLSWRNNGDPDGDAVTFFLETYRYEVNSRSWRKSFAGWVGGRTFAFTAAQGLINNGYFAWRVFAADRTQRSNPWHAASNWSYFHALGTPVTSHQTVSLGTVWDEAELGWTGVWMRHGRSNTFDAVWTHPSAGRVTAVLTVYASGKRISVLRRDTSGPGTGRGCRYEGTLARDGVSITGRYSCDWAPGPYTWRARIRTGRTTQTSGGTTHTQSGLVETLTVSARNATPVTSRTVLQAGRRYTIEARGVFNVWSGVQTPEVDAVWCFRRETCGASGKVWDQLRIDGKGISDLAGRTISYNPNHVYRVTIVGSGRPVQFVIQDARAGSGRSNSGALTVGIYAG